METLWTFRTANFTVELACEPEQDMDLSWDEDGEATDKIATGEWDCVTFRVRILGPNGEELGADYLGNSIYADVRDFRREHIGLAAKSRADGTNYGAYFPDMIRTAISEARGELARLQTIRVRQAA